MLDIKLIKNNRDAIVARLGERGGDFTAEIDELIRLENERVAILATLESSKSVKNKLSADFGKKKKAGLDTSSLSEEITGFDERIKQCENQLEPVLKSIESALHSIPNVPSSTVPSGKDAADNTVYRVVGEQPTYSFEPKAHWDIGESLGILDFEAGAKISGSRFTVLHGMGARLERALINFMLDTHASRGYTEQWVPQIVNAESMTATGQLPKFAEEAFKIEGLDYYLIPTAEVPLTNIYRDSVLDAASFPIRFVAYSACFRKEAGAYGQDVRGLIRQHQFDKVEIVKFSHPDRSYEELEGLLLDAEEILKRLNLPYRVITLCTGDMGFSSAKTYDIEVWLPGQKQYREISSCSNFEDFQARRGNIKFRDDKSKKLVYAHTLNGSGLAVGRTVVAILENCQQADGSVKIPDALVPYMGGIDTLNKA